RGLRHRDERFDRGLALRQSRPRLRQSQHQRDRGSGQNAVKTPALHGGIPQNPRGRTQNRPQSHAAGEAASLPPNERSDSKVLTKSTWDVVAGGSLARNWRPVSPGGHVFLGLAGFLAAKAEIVELPVKRRAADTAPARECGHLRAVGRDGEANHVGFEFLERPYVAGGVEQREGAVTRRRGRCPGGGGRGGGARRGERGRG